MNFKEFVISVAMLIIYNYIYLEKLHVKQLDTTKRELLNKCRPLLFSYNYGFEKIDTLCI